MKPEAMNTWLQAVQIQRGRRAQGARAEPMSASEELRNTHVNKYKNPETGRPEIMKIRPWHERLVDYMLLNPHETGKQMAAHFHVTPQWIYDLSQTDAFKAYYQGRIAAHQQALSDTVILKTQSVATKALDKLAENLDNKDLPNSEVRYTAEMAIKALGYGTRPGGPAVQVNVNHGPAIPVMTVPGNVVEEARARMAEKRAQNTSEIQDTTSEYMRVTASMEVTPEMIENGSGVEDADVIEPVTGAAQMDAPEE